MTTHLRRSPIVTRDAMAKAEAASATHASPGKPAAKAATSSSDGDFGADSPGWWRNVLNNVSKIVVGDFSPTSTTQQGVFPQAREVSSDRRAVDDGTSGEEVKAMQGHEQCLPLQPTLEKNSSTHASGAPDSEPTGVEHSPSRDERGDNVADEALRKGENTREDITQLRRQVRLLLGEVQQLRQQLEDSPQDQQSSAPKVEYRCAQDEVKSSGIRTTADAINSYCSAMPVRETDSTSVATSAQPSMGNRHEIGTSTSTMGIKTSRKPTAHPLTAGRDGHGSTQSASTPSIREPPECPQSSEREPHEERVTDPARQPEEKMLMPVSQNRNPNNVFRFHGTIAKSANEKIGLKRRLRLHNKGSRVAGLYVHQVDRESVDQHSKWRGRNTDAMPNEQPMQSSMISLFDNPTADPQKLIRTMHTRAKLETSQGPGSYDALADDLQHFDDRSANEDNKPIKRSVKERSEQSLLEELFPEATTYAQPHYTARNPYPKLEPPKSKSAAHKAQARASSPTNRQRMLEDFQTRGEPITALQLLHCSTELTESDFRRLVPKGKHINSWARGGEFHKVIPGRDPISLERLPFYYLCFKSAEAALAYQNNAARLHKLSGLHQSTSIFSAIPPPKGYLEDGEDLDAAMSSYLLQSPDLRLQLNMIMQPYNLALRSLFEDGGYKPIVNATSEPNAAIWKVLLHIEGWEPSSEDLFYILTRHAYDRGLVWPFHKAEHAISKLRDCVDIKTRIQAVSSASPRASSESRLNADSTLDFLNVDPLQHPESGKGTLSQVMMNRLYNRWIVEFTEEDAARRFARVWNRRALPAPKVVTWRDTEETRMVNAEFLW